MCAEKNGQEKPNPAEKAGRPAGPAPVQREHLLFGAVGLAVGVLLGYTLAFQIHRPSRPGFEPPPRPAAMAPGSGMAQFQSDQPPPFVNPDGSIDMDKVPPELRQQMEQAKEMLNQHRKMLEEDPENVDLLLTLGRFYLEMGRVDEGLDHLAKAAALEPANVQVQVEVGHALFDAGRNEEALAAYRAAQKTEPGNPDLYAHEGLVQLRMDRVDEALAALDRAAAMDPNHGMSRFNKAVILLYAKQDPDAAEKALEEAARVVPETYEGLDLLRRAIKQFRETGTLPEVHG